MWASEGRLAGGGLRRREGAGRGRARPPARPLAREQPGGRAPPSAAWETLLPRRFPPVRFLPAPAASPARSGGAPAGSSSQPAAGARAACPPARPRVPGRGVRCLYAGYSRNSFSSAFPLFPGGSRTARVCLKKPNKTKQKNPKPNRKPDQKNNTRILFPARLLPDIPARSAEGAGLRGGRAPRRRRRRWGRGAAAGAAAARGCRASAARPAPGAALLVCS